MNYLTKVALATKKFDEKIISAQQWIVELLGEEYDNVVFVISKGWNQYQFETYAPMITGHTPIPNGKQTSYERNRNLFYVCCSRPRKRLFFFVSVPIDAAFRAFLVDLVGEENIYTYSQYLEAKQE